jgi:hypothetical protein
LSLHPKAVCIDSQPLLFASLSFPWHHFVERPHRQPDLLLPLFGGVHSFEHAPETVRVSLAITASAVASFFRAPPLEQPGRPSPPLHQDEGFQRYHGMKPDHRLPSPLPPSSAFRPDLSRASSTSSQASNGYFTQPQIHDRASSLSVQDHNKTTLPGLSQITGLAASQTPNRYGMASTSIRACDLHSSSRSYSATHAPMSFHNPIQPMPTPGFAGSAPVSEEDSPFSSRLPVSCPGMPRPGLTLRRRLAIFYLID